MNDYEGGKMNDYEGGKNHSNISETLYEEFDEPRAFS